MNAVLERPPVPVYYSPPGNDQNCAANKGGSKSEAVKSTTYRVRVEFAEIIAKEIVEGFEDFVDIAIVNSRRNEPSKPAADVFRDLGIGDCTQ